MKKVLSMLLAIAMIISMLPVSVFAANTPTVSFETDFSNDLGVGNTFTVTANLENNPGVASVTLSLKWNEKAVAFTGFTMNGRVMKSDVFDVTLGYTAPVVNNEKGIISASDAMGYDLNGALFTANFEIIAETGELGIGLKTGDATEFQMWDASRNDVGAVIDTSAISGLTVGGAAVGPEMPEDAPFTAITTDAGPIVAVEQMGDVEFNYGYVPYYIVTIPADAETAYVTAPDQVVMEDWNTGAMQATAYAADLSDLSTPLYISYNYEETVDGVVVEVPMCMVASDWSGEVELDFVNTHAFGIEDAGYACLGLISFVYGEAAEEEKIYSITIDENIVGGTITAQNENNEVITTAKEGDLVCLNIAADEGYTAKTWGYIFNGQTYHCENGAFNMPAGDVTLTATFQKQQPEVVGYRFATSADVSAENGGTAVVHVKITGHSDPAITTYNAYDLTLTYDNTKLEFVSGEGADKGDQIKIERKGENQIQIVGVGDDKGFDVEVATLTFKTIAEGAANVTIDKVQVSDKDEAVTEDIPAATPQHKENDSAADETPDVSVIVVPYSVTKPDFVSGADKVLQGESYTFSYTDTTNYTYADLTVTVGGVEVVPAEENGVYTIANVTGTVVITATQTPNSYVVTKPENVTGPEKAAYGTDYVFTVTPGADMAVDTVKVTDAAGKEIAYTINENGAYVIAGTAITGAFTITVTEKDKMTTITFTGIAVNEIEGGLTQTAEIGKAFTFVLIKEEGYAYTAKVGETVLTETDGVYTIPAELVVKGGVQVNVEKADSTRPTVDVTEHVKVEGKSMFLITAKWRDKVLAYGEDTMFWSDKYTVTGETEAGAYCWLVISSGSIDDVKAAAEAAIVEAAEGATATAVKYNYDINGTTRVDVNDAQLAYDMYNASYMEFTEKLPMLKFLEADMNADAKLDTKDVAAIIGYIVSSTNA